MKTDMNKVALLIASAVWADGCYEDDERAAVNEIAEALDYDKETFAQAVGKAFEGFKQTDPDSF